MVSPPVTATVTWLPAFLARMALRAHSLWFLVRDAGAADFYTTRGVEFSGKQV